MKNSLKKIKNYCLNKLIGRGSFGESTMLLIYLHDIILVWLAYNSENENELSAVKVLNKKIFQDKNYG